MLRNKKIKRNWNNEDISLLVWVVSKRMEIQALSHFSEFVSTILFRPRKIGNSFQNSSPGPPGRNANLGGSVSRKSNQSPINGPKINPNFLATSQLRIPKLTGNWSLKNFIKKIPQKSKFSEQLSNAGNTGIVFSTPIFKKVLGPYSKIEDFFNMFSNSRGPKNGLKSLSLWKAVHKML